jgi:hypothetical protein
MLRLSSRQVESLWDEVLPGEARELPKVFRRGPPTRFTPAHLGCVSMSHTAPARRKLPSAGVLACRCMEHLSTRRLFALIVISTIGVGYAAVELWVSGPRPQLGLGIGIALGCLIWALFLSLRANLASRPDRDAADGVRSRRETVE